MNDLLTHTVAAVVLDISYLITGIVLSFIGQKLLIKGVEGRTKLEGDIAGGKWSLNTTSPGIVFAVCGLAVIIYAIVTPSMYEKKITETNSGTITQQQTIDSSMSSAERTTITRSRLFDQSSSDAALKSLIVMYAIQHNYQNLDKSDVSSRIAEMPTKANQEPFSKTKKRFNAILIENPFALIEIMNSEEYKWILEKDEVDRSFSTIVENEIKMLNSNSN